jgi:Zn-finger nucleic acid-binding protein
MELTCPKCRGAMRQYERSGVHVDQCSECRGIFLDRGELERLIDAEAAFHTPAAAHQADRPSGDRQRRDGGYRHDDDDDRYRSSYGGHPKRRKSFLSELFD